MPELDQVWSQMLANAQTEAEDSGRGDVANYLRLKASNDAVRRAGVDWLLDTFIEIATTPNISPTAPVVERDEPHRFARGSSNMVGTRLNIRHGVRCLSIEAGWARTPSDGIMIKGALAFARITHFGMPRANAEIRLVHADTSPIWIAEDDTIIDTGKLRGHFDLLVS